MIGKREILRQRAQLRRHILKAVAQQESVERQAQVSAMVDEIRAIVSHGGFVSIAKSHGVISFPQRLAILKTSANKDVDSQAKRSDDIFDFIIAWKFIVPMIRKTDVAEYLNDQWPGFIEAFKDMFISLVTNGPFPDERKAAIRPTFLR